MGGVLTQLQGVAVEGQQAGLLTGGAGAQADADLNPPGGCWGALAAVEGGLGGCRVLAAPCHLEKCPLKAPPSPQKMSLP